MKIPKNLMPKRGKVMKKIRKALDKKSEEDDNIDLGNLAIELSERRNMSVSEDFDSK